MKIFYFIPGSQRIAAAHLRFAFPKPLADLTKAEFVRAWSSIAYLFPGLHPEGFEDAQSGWPRVLRGFAVEAWRRAEAGDLDDEELYPSDAQWSGLYDQIRNPISDERHRRQKLAKHSLDCARA